MKLPLAILVSIAASNAAAITITKTVVVVTQYVTETISGTPYTLATEVVSSMIASSEPAPSSGALASDGDLTVVSTMTAPTTTATSSTSTTELTTPTTLTTSSTSSTSTTSSTTSSATSSLSSFESEILAEHNIKRALHGTDPLTWDTTLAQYAADYAASSFSCDDVQLIHSGGPYGENLAAGYTGGAAPVDAWYNEIEYYDYSDPGYSSATGHFTQVVWASTTKVGCAMVACDNIWRQYTICEYSPAGNVIGAFEENVLPLV